MNKKKMNFNEFLYFLKNTLFQRIYWKKFYTLNLFIFILLCRSNVYSSCNVFSFEEDMDIQGSVQGQIFKPECSGALIGIFVKLSESSVIENGELHVFKIGENAENIYKTSFNNKGPGGIMFDIEPQIVVDSHCEYLFIIKSDSVFGVKATSDIKKFYKPSFLDKHFSNSTTLCFSATINPTPVNTSMRSFRDRYLNLESVISDLITWGLYNIPLK